MADKLFVFEDDAWRRFLPIAWSRPVWGLRCGIMTLAEKVVRVYPQASAHVLCRDFVEALVEMEGVSVNSLDVSPDDGLLLVNARCVVEPGFALRVDFDSDEGFYQCPGGIAAIRMGGSRARSLRDVLVRLHEVDAWGRLLDENLPAFDVDVRMASGLWDLVAWTPDEIVHEAERMVEDADLPYATEVVSTGVVILGENPVLVHPDATIDPGVVLDARAGPIVLESGVHVQAFTLIEGPAWIGEGTVLSGGRIRRGCSIGPQCRIGGEVENSVIQGYSNKCHEGFLGHAYVGEWVNLGALTTNSDLKNTYGDVKVWCGGEVVSTGSNKVGCFIGDHAKTGIGTLLTTGLVVGFAANVFGGGVTGGRIVPDFAWGGQGGWVEHRLDEAMRTARVVMSRRDAEFTDADRRVFERVFAETRAVRERWLAEANAKKSHGALAST